MARHSQPRELAELKGLTRHNPQRYRNEPPKHTMPIGQPPEHMSEEAKVVWFELETYVAPGVLTASERLLLEVLSNLVSEYRKDPIQFAVGKYTHLTSYMARLGMSPADRQKLNIGTGKDEDDDPMSEFV